MSTKTGQMRFEALKDEESGEYRDEPVAAVSGGFQGNGRQPASLSHTPSLAPDPSLQAMRRGGVQEVAIIAGDLGYFPRVFFVNRDIPVRLFVTGASRGALCFLMDSFQVRKQIRSQRIEEISFTPSQPGTYRFHCPVNGMEGTMVVRELASREDSQ
jgi:heme/copper-type cytochrome/quinol oxidase subunit 2